MFPLSQRLLLRQDSDFFKSSKRWYGEFVTIFYQTTQELSKGAVIVPKKILKKATERNRLRRQLRAIVSQYMYDLVGFNLVVVAKKEAINQTYSALQNDMEKFFTAR